MRVINCFTDPRLGGPGRRSLDVGKKLDKKGVDIHFLIPKGDDSLANAAVEAGFEVHRLSIPRIRSPRDINSNIQFLVSFRRTTHQIRSLFSSLSPDIIHVNTPYNFQTAYAAAQSEGSLVWQFNDTLTPWPINRIAGRLANRWADEIIVSADAVRDHFFSSEVETRTIYPPVDLNKFNPNNYQNAPKRLRDELNIEDNAFVIGTIGNVNPAKGHKYLLNAIPDVLDEFPDSKFLIVGSQLDSQQRYYRNLQDLVSRLGIEDAVQFVGWRSDIPELLSLFDLFVLPSVTEACPIVVLEAMAMGCPVVATDVGGVSEQLPSDTYGWVVPPKDPAALGIAIIQSLSSERKRKTTSQNGKKRVENEFSLNQSANEHYTVYSNILSG